MEKETIMLISMWAVGIGFAVNSVRTMSLGLYLLFYALMAMK